MSVGADLWFCLAIALLLASGAFHVGRLTEARRWRRNVDAIQRIESNGGLYKVTKA